MSWNLLAVLLVAVISVNCETYYVVPIASVNNCPQNKYCYTLSHYLSSVDKYFHSNVVFYFMEGTHLLDRQVSISNLNNLTFRNWIDSNVVISCNGRVGGFSIKYSQQVYLIGIVVANCVANATSNNAILNLDRVSLFVFLHSSVQNNSGVGMSVNNVNFLIIRNSSFLHNGLDRFDVAAGNLLVSSYSSHFRCTIANSDFQYGKGYYGCLTIAMYYSNISITIENIVVNHGLAYNTRGSANINVYIVGSNIDLIHLYDINSSYGVSIDSFDSQGGGFYFAMVNSTCYSHTSIKAINVKLSGNYARSGGGMFVYFSASHNCIVNFDNISLINNGGYFKLNNRLEVCSDGGGVLIQNYINCTNTSVSITNAKFKGNVALNGGAFNYAGSCETSVLINNSSFEGNIGFIGAAVVGYFISLSNADCNFKLVDVTVQGNTRYSVEDMKIIMSQSFSYNVNFRHSNINGALVFASDDKPYSISVQNLVVKNNFNVSGMVLRGCNVKFAGNKNVFINNSSPRVGGGLVILTINNYFEVNDGNHLYFINNTAGVYGGAIYVMDTSIEQYDVSYLDFSYNYDYDYYKCIFNTNQTFDKIHNISNHLVSFKGNKASLSGDDVYGGSYHICNVIPNNVHIKDQLKCPLTKYWTLDAKGTIASSPFAVCLCVDGTKNCTVRSINKFVFPGQTLTISLVTVGSCAGISPGSIISSIEGGDLFLVSRDQLTTTHCKSFAYTSSQIHPTANITINSAGSTFDNSGILIKMTYLKCPIGFHLSTNGTGSCVCNNALSDNDVHCNIDDTVKPFTRKGNNWISYINSSQQGTNCTVVHIGCPFDYCNSSNVSFSLTFPKPQCALKRSGVLCGHCQHGLSLMLGSNQCTHCNNTYISLLAVFILAGIILMFILIVLNLTVSTGVINGLLFYANIVKLNEPVFFPTTQYFPLLKQFIFWLNLDLGIETCFFNGLNGYWKTWLQFVFPIYLWFLALVVIIGCHYSLRLSRICSRNAVPVLVTLFLMSYTKLLRNITNVFMFTRLVCNKHQWYVWTIDGNVRYFSTLHVILFIFSIILLLIGAVYTLLVLMSQWLQRCSFVMMKIKPIVDAHCGPYKTNCQFWTGFLLVIRLLLAALFSYTTSTLPQVNSFIIAVTVLLLLCLSSLMGGIYRSRKLNGLELISYVNLGLMSIGSSFQHKYMQTIVSNVSVAIAFVLLLIIFAVSCKPYCSKFVANLHGRNSTQHEIPLIVGDENTTVDNSPGSPARVLMRRESLIFDFTEDLKEQ